MNPTPQQTSAFMALITDQIETRALTFRQADRNNAFADPNHHAELMKLHRITSELANDILTTANACETELIANYYAANHN